MGRHFTVKFFTNQSQKLLEYAYITILLLFAVQSIRACSICQLLAKNRLTNLKLCLDSTNSRAKEERTFGRILNMWYRIMLQCITAQTYECSERASVLLINGTKTRRDSKARRNYNKILSVRIKLSLTRTNRNVDMQMTTVNQLQICRSGSTVVDKEEKNQNDSHSNSSCEVLQSQRILEEAKALKKGNQGKLDLDIHTWINILIEEFKYYIW